MSLEESSLQSFTQTEVAARKMGIPTFHLPSAAFYHLKPDSHALIGLHKYSHDVSEVDLQMLRSYQEYLEMNFHLPVILFFTRYANSEWTAEVSGKKKRVDYFHAGSLLQLLDRLEGRMFIESWQRWKDKHKEIFE